MFRRHLLLACLPMFVLFAAGCDKLGLGGKAAEPQAKSATASPRAALRKVPCVLSLGQLAATLRVDLQEVKGLVLDAQQIYREIVEGEPSGQQPPKGLPTIMVVNKKNNKFTYFQITPHVKEVRLRSQETRGVEMVVHNKEPLDIELWIDSDKDIEIDVEFKENSSEAR